MDNLLINFGNALKKFPDINFVDALSYGQIKSKMWLIDELSKITTSPGLTFILGGWYGILASMMFESNKFQELTIRSFDINPQCADIADTINRTPWVLESWKFKASTADMYNLNYNETIYETLRANKTSVKLIESPQTIINTSCEHLEKFDYWLSKIPSNKLIVLQSNNFFNISDHINCVNSIEEFLEKTNFKKIFYSGELEFEKYKRFMLIGEK